MRDINSKVVSRGNEIEQMNIYIPSDLATVKGSNHVRNTPRLKPAPASSVVIQYSIKGSQVQSPLTRHQELQCK
jgi:hypothetical protein